MTNTILETTVTWMPVEHPAASPHVQGPGLLPISSRLRGEVCPQGGGAEPAGAPGGLLGSRPAGGMGLDLRDAVIGARTTGLPVYRAADLAPTAIQQDAFPAGSNVLTVPTTTVSTTPVRNEKKQEPGPSVLRPPL